MGYKYQKEDIIDTASELIRKEGYHNVGINDILKACAIPKGSFYNFFESKEDFGVEMVLRYGEQSRLNVESYLTNAELSPLNRLHTFYSEMVDVNVSDGLNGGCLINNLSNEVGGISTKMAESLEFVFNRILDTIEACVLEGQESGEIINTMPARNIAEYLHNGFSGTFGRMKVQRNREYMDKWVEMTFQFIKA